MMNNVTGINVSTPQMTFKAKAGDRKTVHEFIDKSHDMAMDYLNKDRPINEKREKLIRDTLLKLKIKCPFVGKKIKHEEAAIEHPNKLLETVESFNRQAYYEDLRRSPQEFKEVMMRDAEHQVASMTNFEIIKTILKGFLKKQPEAEYVQKIEKAVQDGMIDADQAGAMLVNPTKSKLI